ncbi:serine/threonine protein phosphatase [Anaerolinea thermolimosa]|uniref:PP2C family protein-serine/threonine phosphatase n=1 Tax=Anaerolinea thermolimosa TaxID=229919 RepID=UPI000783484F|nr:protein phosphatase 2C domain-containing protein [Anaerolinea thermolimosa]GAP07784.1 serine/threonine protein phosphatase [Anaerolinea thermolimosa]
MIRLKYTQVPVAAISHPGRKRKENEDRYGVAAFSAGPEGPSPILLAVLSDGIGGHRAGEIAAEMAVNIISQVVERSHADHPPATLIEAIQTASEAIRIQALHNPEQAGMGATCACAWMIGNRLYTATVGDSRVYLIRGGQIRRLSTDHTWIQEAIENGMLRPEEANTHPNAHVIRRYLGSPTPPEVDLRLRISDLESDAQAEANQGFLLAPGDTVALTSDGLTDLVSDAEILAAFQQGDAETACHTLVDLALERGGHDNITLVAFKAPAEVRLARPRQRRNPAWRWVAAGCAGVLLVAALAGAILGGWLWLRRESEAFRLSPTPTHSLLVQTTLPPSPAAMETPVPARGMTPTQPLLATSSTLPGFEENGATITPWPTNTRPASP